MYFSHQCFVYRHINSITKVHNHDYKLMGKHIVRAVSVLVSLGVFIAAFVLNLTSDQAIYN
jgi:hypothetical protein